MKTGLRDTFRFFLGSSVFERRKIIWITLSFLFILASYTIMREMRDTLFLFVVGRQYIQYAQLISMGFLIPALFMHSRLVDRLSKYQLFYVYGIFYTVVAAISAILVGVLGIEGLRSYGILVWIFYILIEAFAPFVVSIMYAFINSTTRPDSVGHTYSLIIAGSKIGGMLSAGLAWIFLQHSFYSDTTNHALLLACSAVLIGLVPAIIYYLQSTVPEKFLHGYEASYKVNQMLEKRVAHQSWFKTITAGPRLMAKYPYVFGIFVLVFCWEVVSVIINFNRLCYGATNCTTPSQLSGFLFSQIFWVHTLGMIISLCGVRVVVSWFGERRALALVPILTGFFIVMYYASSTPIIIAASYVLIRAINYSLAISTREILYIPTTKEVRYKSKSWIDAFGTKIARGSGALYNLAITPVRGNAGLIGSVFCMAIVAIWWFVSQLLGTRYEGVIASNNVIGKEDLETPPQP